MSEQAMTWTDDQLDAALALRFDSDAGKNLTIREWLISLLLQVWIEQEGFSGKRPWGNSGWDYDVYWPLVRDGLIFGVVDEEAEYMDDLDEDAGRALVAAMIRRLGSV